MTTGRKYFSGNTLEIALMQAARHHGLQPEEVAYRKIEKRHGFLKARKGVVIEVDPESPGQTPEEPLAKEDQPIREEPMMETTDPPRTVIESSVPEVQEEMAAREEFADAEDAEPEAEEEAATSEELSKADGREPEVDEIQDVMDDELQEPVPIGDLMDAARRGLEEILEFAKLDLEVEVSEGEGQLEIELSGVDRERLVEDRGNLLLAIQHLLPRLIRGYTDRSISCHVDSEGFHASREVELEKMAQEAAQEVRERQRPRTLPPMNPAERRIIHVTLVDDNEVTTESQGRGFFKRVTITPAMRRPRGFDRY